MLKISFCMRSLPVKFEKYLKKLEKIFETPVPIVTHLLQGEAPFKLFASSVNFLGEKPEDQVVGCILGKITPCRIVCQYAHVKKEFRKRGIFTTMLHALENYNIVGDDPSWLETSLQRYPRTVGISICAPVFPPAFLKESLKKRGFKKLSEQVWIKHGKPSKRIMKRKRKAFRRIVEEPETSILNQKMLPLWYMPVYLEDDKMLV